MFNIKSILIIDDDPINNLINKKKISKLLPDCNIQIRETAEAALEHLKLNLQNPTDYILLDINMPNMSGWDFLKEFRKLNQSANIIIVTSSINKDDVEKAKSFAEIRGYLIKPVEEEDWEKIFSNRVDWR